MPGAGPDQRDQRSRNRRPRRRSQSSMRAPVTEYEEQQEIEAARERNDLDISDLREMSVTELRCLGLRIGARVGGAVRAPREGEKYWGMLRVDSVNGVDTETARRRPVFGDLTPVHPDVLINLETDPKNLS